MSLVKIPLILISTVGCEIAYTSPNPPPKAAERISFVDHEDFYTKINIGMSMLARMITLLLAFCEVWATLIASFPTLSNHLLIIPAVFGVRPEITTTFLVGWTLIVLGALLRLLCYRTLGQHFTFELSLRKNQTLITHGPYSIVRHPSYIGTMLVTTGMVMCHLGRGSWLNQSGFLNHGVGIVAALAWTSILKSVDVMILARIGKEDAVLKKEFEDEWQAWVKRTPYKLVPFIY